jgi:hypothetical protein
MKKNKTKLPAFLSIVLFSLLLSGCFSVRPAARKTMEKYTETFLTEKGVMYFIKPFAVKGENKDEKIYLDFTFINESSDSAIVNFSLYAQESIKELKSILFKNSSGEIYSEHFKLLFNEKNKNQYISRFSTTIPVIELKKLFSNENWVIEITTPDVKKVYQPKNNIKKMILKLNESLFQL